MVVGEVEVPGAWAVEEVAVTGEEIGEVEMMVATGVTDIQIGGWGWWVVGWRNRESGVRNWC